MWRLVRGRTSYTVQGCSCLVDIDFFWNRSVGIVDCLPLLFFGLARSVELCIFSLFFEPMLLLSLTIFVYISSPLNFETGKIGLFSFSYSCLAFKVVIFSMACSSRVYDLFKIVSIESFNLFSSTFLDSDGGYISSFWNSSITPCLSLIFWI